MYLEQPGQTPQLITYPAPEPDPERPVLFDAEVQVAPNVEARIVVRRAKEPLSQGFSRATRRGGLVIRSGRAAHETTLASFEGRPGARHLYGEVFCEAIEQLQRDALERPRPELVVKVDRSGLNEHHPIVERLYQAIDRVLRPIVAAEERRAGAHLIGAPRAVTARDQVGLRALNDLLKSGVRPARDSRRRARDNPGDKPPATGRPSDPPKPRHQTRNSRRRSRADRRIEPAPRAAAGAGAVVQAVADPASPRREAHGHAASPTRAGAARDRRRDRGRPGPDASRCAPDRSPSPAPAATARCRRTSARV